MSVSRAVWLSIVAAALQVSAPAWATIPYTPVSPTGASPLGPGVEVVSKVPGKEYSADFDHTTAGLGGSPDPQQVVAWDGIGGTADGIDFSGTRPSWTLDQEIDAIANGRDRFFNAIREDEAHLVFSYDDQASAIVAAPGAGLMAVPLPLPGGGPVLLSNGNLIGGSGELSVEEAGAFSASSTQSLWASQAEINGMPLPRDIDGVELWGPEPAFTEDTNKYSLDLDFLSGVSVWNGNGTPYIDHSTIVSAVESLLGPIPGPAFLPFDNQEGINAINLDALMVSDVGEQDIFDGDPTGGGGPTDFVIFSIRQIIDLADPTGYYATGSELFVLGGDGTISFLAHGGHVWDKSYALAELSVLDPFGNNLNGVIDINAIEAIASIPEPAAAALLFTCLGSVGAMRWRLG